MLFANGTVTNVFYALQEVAELIHVGTKKGAHEFDGILVTQVVLLSGSVLHFAWVFVHWLRSLPHRLRGFWRDTDGAITLPLELPRPDARVSNPKNRRKKSKRRKAKGRGCRR
jgi:hypothetical protein